VTSDDGITLPAWARATPRRRMHIARVRALALSWADAMNLTAAERAAWRDAAEWHDALRDAPESELRTIVPELAWPAMLLHGPAAAARLAADGERRISVLDAIRWHTVGSASWDRTGQALYMADFLEPGRTFAQEVRAALAARVPLDFDGTFRDVVRCRLSAKIAASEPMLAETAALWASVQ
jgi:HD superfamily phosphohydrolase YqeK